MGKKSIIADLRKKIEQKEKELGDSLKVSYNAGCSLQLDRYNTVDITTVRNKYTLAVLAGKVIGLKETFEKGAKALGLSDAKFKISGFTADEWLEDIKSRAELLDFIEKKQQIDIWKAKLDSLLTEDEWREMEIDKLREELED